MFRGPASETCFTPALNGNRTGPCRLALWNIIERSSGMDKDRIAGSAKDFAGKVEANVGNAADDAQSQAEGRLREVAGKAQNLYGQAKDAARDAKDAAA